MRKSNALYKRLIEQSPQVTFPKPPSAGAPTVELAISPKLASRSAALAPIPVRPSITDYSDRELQSLLVWVQSDGKLRTHDEIADEMFAALPFSRRGSKIESVLRETIGFWDVTRDKF
jgi:hypothetical protein